MRSTRLVVFLTIAVMFGLTAAPAAAGDVTTPSLDAQSNESTQSGGNLTVSSFMQSSAADAESSVESGLFETKYENADDDKRAALVDDRTAALETQLEALEAERELLEEVDENVSTGEYRARSAKLAIGIVALERSLERTIPRANETGVDRDRLDDLRSNASDLSGSAVAAEARGIAGLEQFDGGPPALDEDGNWTVPGQNDSALDEDGNWTVPGQNDSVLDGDGNWTPPAQDENAAATEIDLDAAVAESDDDHPANRSGDGSSSAATGTDSSPADDAGPPDQSGGNEGQGPDLGSDDT
ncbi:hypothetical protein [Natrialba swarupiae]|uniref:Uncharacterized protein n=1 Tax=Natrialba swarupiae TaxID=2448032 RepID=A0A5D5AMN7_9EURY|nr:hypothetical protein [Natrialba swarupiae]TYT62926.1 hypothetical protein FYC77_06325 [Natrialba swarupiae]